MNKPWQEKVLHYVKEHPFEGFDPYDLLSLNTYTRSLMYPFKELRFDKKISFLFLSIVNDWFPSLVRKVFFVKKKIHPTYLGMLLHSEALLPKKYYDEKRVQLIKKEIIKCRSKGYKNHCWGTPFAWRSGDTFYPTGTPFAVVCAWIGEGYLALYERNEQEEDLIVCKSICDFFVQDLIIKTISDDSICFSYSPNNESDVNNSNLMVASFLMKVGHLIGNEEYKTLAKKATNFTVDSQLSNGLIPYFANKNCSHNDSYHSSYELKALFDIIKLEQNEKWRFAFEKYLDYYLENYFHDDFSVSKYPRRPFPVDGTAMADALILLYKIQTEYKHLKICNYIDGIENIIRKEWVKKNGSIKYKKLNKYVFSSITYTRWIMGWFAIVAAYKLEE